LGASRCRRASSVQAASITAPLRSIKLTSTEVAEGGVSVLKPLMRSRGVELFDCDADGYPMEGIWLQQLNPNGQICELTVMLRPYPAVTVLRNRTKELAEKSGLLDAGYWELAKPQ
jgi:hypothetical protein